MLENILEKIKTLPSLYQIIQEIEKASIKTNFLQFSDSLKVCIQILQQKSLN